MNWYQNKLIMYYEVNKLNREGHSISYIAEYLVMNWRTVKKFLSMDDREYEQFLSNQFSRFRVLSQYEHFVKLRLDKYPDTSAAQMHDWLKEYDDSFPDVHPKTVYNFVMWVRQNYLIPKEKILRDFHLVDQLPYARQAQVDFGQYNMRTSTGKTKKVYFMVTVLSRSRFKHVFFTDFPFTTLIAIEAHEKAFGYFQGIPLVMVYDQDTVFIKDENAGDLILTRAFKDYVNLRGFNTHFCRKADPQSKGKVENAVKYVKQSLLLNRPYYDLETLQSQAFSWAARTANEMAHGVTKLSPRDEWLKEKEFLTPWSPITLDLKDSKLYTVRKDNAISYKSNLYSLPAGTWTGKGTQVLVCQTDDTLVIKKVDGTVLCSHEICQGQGQIFANTDHKRDKSLKINLMMTTLAAQFSDPELALAYFEQIKKLKNRYLRDQLQIINTCLSEYPHPIVNQCLIQCYDQKIFSAVDFRSVAESVYKSSGEQKSDLSSIRELSVLPGGNTDKIRSMQPNKSQIQDYDSIINKH